jgi:hypothetical protein
MKVTRSRVGNRNANSSFSTSASFPALNRPTPIMSEQQIEKLVVHQRITGFCPDQLQYVFSLWLLSANIRLDMVQNERVKTLLQGQLQRAALMLHELPTYVNTILRVSATISNCHCHDRYLAHISSEQGGSFDLAAFHDIEPALLSSDDFLGTLLYDLLPGSELVVGRSEIMRYSVRLLLHHYPFTLTLLDWRVGDSPDSNDGSWGHVWYHVKLHAVDKTFLQAPSAWLQRTDLMTSDQGEDQVMCYEQMLAQAYTSMLYAPPLSRQDQRGDWYVLIPAPASNSKKRLISTAQIARINIKSWTAWMQACDSESPPEISEDGFCRVPTVNPDTGRREWKQVPLAGDWHVRRIIRLLRLLHEAVNGKQLPPTLDSWTNAVDELFSLYPEMQQRLRDMSGNDDGDAGSEDSKNVADEVHTFTAERESSEDRSDDQACPDTNLDSAGAEILDDDQVAGLLLAKLHKMTLPQQSTSPLRAADVGICTPSVEPVGAASPSTSPGLMLDTGLLHNTLSPLEIESPVHGQSRTTFLPPLTIHEELVRQYDQLYGLSSREMDCSSFENLMSPPGGASRFSTAYQSAALCHGNLTPLISSEMSWSPDTLSSGDATDLPSACLADTPETPHALFLQRQALEAAQQSIAQHSEGSAQRAHGLQTSTGNTHAGLSSEETKSAVDVTVPLQVSRANGSDNNRSTSHNARLISYNSEGTPSRVVVQKWENIGERGLFVCDDFAPLEEVGPMIGIEVQQRRSNHGLVFGVRKGNKDVSLDVQGRWPLMINHAPPHLANVDFNRDTWKVFATKRIPRSRQAFFDYGVDQLVDELMEKDYEHYERNLPQLLPFYELMHARVRNYSWLLRIFRKCNPSEAMRLALIALYLCHQCLRESASV